MARFEADESCCCGARITCASNDLSPGSVREQLRGFREAHAACREKQSAGGTVGFSYGGQEFGAGFAAMGA